MQLFQVNSPPRPARMLASASASGMPLSLMPFYEKSFLPPPRRILARRYCRAEHMFSVMAASMELLSGCAIITAYEKAVNRIRILVVGRTPPVRPRRQRRLFLSPLKCIAGGKAGLTFPSSGGGKLRRILHGSRAKIYSKSA